MFVKINIPRKIITRHPKAYTIDYSKFIVSNQQYTKGQVISYQFVIS